MTVYIDELDIQRPGELGSGAWHLSGLSHCTIIFGKNSSGKSLLLRAWRNQNVQSCHYVAPERTGEITFEPGQIQAQQKAESRSQQTPYNLAPNYRQQVIARITTYFASRGGHRGGTPLPGDPGELEKLLSLLLPDFSMQLIANDTPPYELVRLASGQKVSRVQDLSSGEAQVLTIGLDVLTIAAMWDLEGKEERILLLDEPDAHIHPDLQLRLADFLAQVITKFQLQAIIATHSTTLLAALGQRAHLDPSVIYLDRVQTSFAATHFDEVKRETAAILGGHILTGTLFSAPLLLVEGDDDARIWSQVPRHHILSLAVLPCEGHRIRKYQSSLEQILRSLNDSPKSPFGYALLDGDQPLPMPNQENKQEYIRFVRLGCRESENLFLTDEVLAELGTGWLTASTAIAQESQNFGQKASLLSSPSAWDRRDHEVKPLINEISMILDPKNVHWTVRVGHAIGRIRPSGMLASFLGDDLVDALWGKAPGSPEEISGQRQTTRGS